MVLESSDQFSEAISQNPLLARSTCNQKTSMASQLMKESKLGWPNARNSARKTHSVTYKTY